ncbi:MAG TPA: hypothetical protein ENJ64_02985, partial [Thiotrichales bacterium]|nr:hypothetical protein [Thiotrichales bacterium]
MSKEHITVAILGVDERSKSAYELFFNSIKHIEYELVDDYRQAQLCLLDRDSYKISQQYETLVSNFPEKYILSISIVPQTLSHDRELYLQKPIKRDVMQSLLEKVCRKIASEPVLAGDGGSVGASKTESPDHAPDAKHGGETGREKFSALFRKKAGGLAAPDTAAQPNNVVPIKGARKAATANAGKLLKIENEEYYVGERPDVDASDPQQLKTVFYSPKMLLQEIIETACEKSRESGRIVQLNILNHDFYFDFSEQKVYTNAGPAVIRPLCVIRH